MDAVKAFDDLFAAAYQRVTGTSFDGAESSVAKAVCTIKPCAEEPNRTLTMLSHSTFSRVCLKSLGEEHAQRREYGITETDVRPDLTCEVNKNIALMKRDTP